MNLTFDYPLFLLSPVFRIIPPRFEEGQMFFFYKALFYSDLNQLGVAGKRIERNIRLLKVLRCVVKAVGENGHHAKHLAARFT